MFLKYGNRLVITFIFLAFFISGCSSIVSKQNAVATSGGEAELSNDGRITKDSYFEKTIFFGTTRVNKCSNQKTVSLAPRMNSRCRSKVGKLTRLDSGNDKTENSINYGYVKVKIPFLRKEGDIKGMSVSDLELNIGLQNFLKNILPDDILIFIHGYKTSFTSAAIRSAQLAHDTNFKGNTVLFSWPSKQGDDIGYKGDLIQAKKNFSLFADFIQNIASQTDKNIHIVAHSMGTFITMNSLSVLSKRMKNDKTLFKSRLAKTNGKLLNQVILAAPDIRISDFKKTYSSFNLKNLAKNYTLYSTDNDKVLSGSRLINWSMGNSSEARLGDSSNEFTVLKGMQTVDSRQKIDAQFFGHSFYAEYPGLITDLHLVLNYGTHPDKRILQRVRDTKNNVLWFIRDTLN